MAKHIFPKPSIIKSIQSGYTYASGITVTVNVNAVDVNKAFVIIGGKTDQAMRAYLSSSTEVKVASAISRSGYLSWFLVEYAELNIHPEVYTFSPGNFFIKSYQYFTVLVDGTVNVTITAVDLNKSIITHQGQSNSVDTAARFTNSTTVTMTRMTTTSSYASINVIEFY